MHEDVPDAGTHGRPPTPGQVAAMLTCHETGCGDALTGKGGKRGWVLIRIVGSGDPARGYCSAHCAARGVARTQLGQQPPPKVEPEPAPVTPIRAETPQPVTDLKSADVKRWAVEQGLIPAVVRGRCPQHLIDAYIAAHGGAS